MNIGKAVQLVIVAQPEEIEDAQQADTAEQDAPVLVEVTQLVSTSV